MQLQEAGRQQLVDAFLHGRGGEVLVGTPVVILCAARATIRSEKGCRHHSRCRLCPAASEAGASQLVMPRIVKYGQSHGQDGAGK